MSLNDYLMNVEGQLKREGGKRESKIEKSMVELVNRLIGENEATTIKRISDELGKRPQQIHQILRKSTTLTKKKLKGRTLVVPCQEGNSDATEAAE